MNPLRRNVLIFHLGALGDFILSWPLAMALARLHPQSRIVYVTHGQKGALAEKLLRVESADIEAGWHALYSDAPALPERSKKVLSGAHSIYSFIAGEADEWARQVRRVAPEADLCCLGPTPPADYSGHSTDHLLAQLTPRKAVAEAVRQMIQSLMNQGLSQQSSTAGPVAIHPGAGAREKCWPIENYLELTRRLCAAGRAVRVLLGEVELERWSASEIERFRVLADVVAPGTYLDLVKSLSDVSAVVGNDSGPAHLAGAIGLPTLVLFGPTDPTVWKPLGPRVRTLRRELIGQIGVEEVLHGLT
jgi:heptosyltransferase III